MFRAKNPARPAWLVLVVSTCVCFCSQVHFLCGFCSCQDNKGIVWTLKVSRFWKTTYSWFEQVLGCWFTLIKLMIMNPNAKSLIYQGRCNWNKSECHRLAQRIGSQPDDYWWGQNGGQRNLPSCEIFPTAIWIGLSTPGMWSLPQLLYHFLEPRIFSPLLYQGLMQTKILHSPTHFCYSILTTYLRVSGTISLFYLPTPFYELALVFLPLF